MSTKTLLQLAATVLSVCVSSVHAADTILIENGQPRAEIVLAEKPARDKSGKLVLVEDRQARVPIVIYKGAPLLTRLAADELAKYIEKASGARPRVIEGWPEPVPERAIWVGYQKGLEKLFPGVDFTFQHPEEILFAANASHLVIAGRDRWDPNCLSLPTNLIESGTSSGPGASGKMVPGIQLEYGTANAVYEFLHQHLGVRWLWPGEVEVPEQSTIAFPPFTYRYHPQMRARMQFFWHLSRGRSSAPGNEESNWYRYNHLQLDSLQTFAGEHGFSDWWDRFGKTHPEYFALQPDGTRSGGPGPSIYAKICESNPAVWEQWLKDVDKRLELNPTQVAFSAAANDSWSEGHCVCERCRAWDAASAPRRMFHWQGVKEEHAALADRQVRFANTLARKLKERYPGRQLYVSILAYGLSRPAPISVKPDDNVIVGSVACFFSDLDELDRAGDNEKQIDQFKAWGKVASNLYWRPNCSGIVQRGLPLSTRMIADNFQVLKEAKAIGIYVDTLYRYWGLCGPAYYLTGRLTWNPDQRAQEVMDDYFSRGFGPAAAEMKQYITLLDDARGAHQPDRTGVDGKTNPYDGAAWAKAYPPAFFEKAEAIFKQGRDKASGDEKFARRVVYLASGLEFLRLETEGRQLIDDIKADRNKAAAIEKLTTNWKRIEAMAKEYPFAIPPHFLTEIRKKPVDINPAALSDGKTPAKTLRKDLDIIK